MCQLCLPDTTPHSPIELTRFPVGRRIQPSDIRFWTADIDPAWHWWIEQPSHARQFITWNPRIDGPASASVPDPYNEIYSEATVPGTACAVEA